MPDLEVLDPQALEETAEEVMKMAARVVVSTEMVKEMKTAQEHSSATEPAPVAAGQRRRTYPAETAPGRPDKLLAAASG